MLILNSILIMGEYKEVETLLFFQLIIIPNILIQIKDKKLEDMKIVQLCLVIKILKFAMIQILILIVYPILVTVTNFLMD